MIKGIRQIAVVTGSRADYGLLLWPIRRIQEESSFRLTVVATGMHLAPAFGMTVDQIAADGIPVTKRVPILGEGDDANAMAAAIGKGVAGFATAFEELRPDLVLLLGDRYEIFAAAQAAYVKKIPIAHLCGGDVTDGALDDAFRHSISKMASLHFPTNPDAARRLRQLGEAEERIHAVGSTGIDAILRAPQIAAADLEKSLGHKLGDRYLLTTFHPVTLDALPSLDQLNELLAALEAVDPAVAVVFTLANADADGRALNAAIEAFAKRRPNSFAHVSLGPERYLNLMRRASAVVGNSSSGLYEAPSFDVPTVNIGRRQEGRLRAPSVIDCPPERKAIGAAIQKALASQPKGTVNPYGDGESSARIVGVLKAIPDWPSLVYKRFQDLP
jgi:UDP-N-acetylglucosamine 2-epimerase (non-hydrolysing)/GDP/UDP-N,N'-diacetylbacillosamine 2-epimerase (hydrolysing)